MIKTENISYSIKGLQLLKNVSIQFQANEIVMIIGPNGAGKSTLIKLLSRQMPISEGKLWVGEKELKHLKRSDLAKTMAVLSQNIEIAFPLSVEEIVMMGRYPHFSNKPGSIDVKICNDAIDFFNVRQLVNRNYLTLSGGEKQRVNFARVAAQIWPESNDKTKYLLLDEPLTYLDIYYQYEFMEKLKELMNKQNMVVVGVVHDLNLAYRYANKIALINGGSLMAFGSAEEVFSKENISRAFRVESHILTDSKGNRFFSF